MHLSDTNNFSSNIFYGIHAHPPPFPCSTGVTGGIGEGARMQLPGVGLPAGGAGGGAGGAGLPPPPPLPGGGGGRGTAVVSGPGGINLAAAVAAGMTVEQLRKIQKAEKKAARKAKKEAKKVRWGLRTYQRGWQSDAFGKSRENPAGNGSARVASGVRETMLPSFSSRRCRCA